jgi:hypothetical protein
MTGSLAVFGLLAPQIKCSNRGFSSRESASLITLERNRLHIFALYLGRRLDQYRRIRRPAGLLQQTNCMFTHIVLSSADTPYHRVKYFRVGRRYELEIGRRSRNSRKHDAGSENSAKDDLGLGHLAGDIQEFIVRLFAGDRIGEALNFLFRARLQLPRRREAVAARIEARCGLAFIAARAGAQERVGLIGLDWP